MKADLIPYEIMMADITASTSHAYEMQSYMVWSSDGVEYVERFLFPISLILLGITSSILMSLVMPHIIPYSGIRRNLSIDERWKKLSTGYEQFVNRLINMYRRGNIEICQVLF